MGDYFQTIVDTEATEAEAPELAARIVAWLVAEGMIEAELSEGWTLGAPGHKPLPGAKAAAKGRTKFDESWGGLEVTAGKRTSFDSGQYTQPEQARCPQCRGTTEFVDEEWEENPELWEPFADALADWEKGGEGLVACAACVAESPVNRWHWRSESLVPGCLGFTFWGWPELTETFREEFARRLGGHNTEHLRGKV
ncbi:hypothetical protein [Streptomyces sp.]|uniref:hypothetical protein n=1 Tax=Streptomyces sp. TaxID=1931 RepID=UPI002F950870